MILCVPQICWKNLEMKYIWFNIGEKNILEAAVVFRSQ